MSAHENRQRDEELTQQLGLHGLYVYGTEDQNNTYLAWSDEPLPEACPFCGSSSFRTHKLGRKSYLDIVRQTNMYFRDYRPITLQYSFHKYRCEACGKTFAPEIHFATRLGKTTNRLDNRVAEWLIHGASYGQVMQNLGNQLTKMTVREILARWVAQKQQQFVPELHTDTLAVISGSTELEVYTMLLALTPTEVRVFDIFYGVGKAEIIQRLQAMDLSGIRHLVSNCDQTIYEAITDLMPGYPGTTYLIPADFWLEMLIQNFADLLDRAMRWSTTRTMRQMMIESLTAGTGYSEDIKKELDKKPVVRTVYEKLKTLADHLHDREFAWIFQELLDWRAELLELLHQPENGLPEAYIQETEITLELLDQYGPQLQCHSEPRHRSLIPPMLIPRISTLQELIAIPGTITDDLLKARVLYSVPAVPDHWTGIRLDDLCSHLRTIYQPEENTHEQQ